MTPIATEKETANPQSQELKLVLKTTDKSNNSFYNISVMNGGLTLDGLEKHGDGYRVKFKKDDGTSCYGLIAGCFKTKNGYELVTEIQFCHTVITITPDDEEAYKVAKELNEDIFKATSTHCP